MRYYNETMVEVLTLHIARAAFVTLRAANMLSFTANSSDKHQYKNVVRERDSES